MPLPWRLNKRMIARKDSDAKKCTSNNVSQSQTQTCAQKSGHEIKKMSCVQPKGIIFNYNIQKGSTLTTNENKSNTKENQNDNHTTIVEPNTENNENLGVDNGTIKPNKMYKIVIVDGNIRLVEHNADEIIEENEERNNADGDSDVELIDTDDHVEANKNKDGSLREHEIAQEVIIGSEDETNMITPIEPISPTKPMPIVSNRHDNCTVPNILNHSLQTGLPKTYTRRNGNTSFTNKLASINDPNSANNNIHTTKKNLAYARSGKPMVLLPVHKYASLKKKLADIQREKEKWVSIEIDYKNEIINAKKKPPKRTMGVQTGRSISEELEELNSLKTRLAKIFTEAQMDVISKSKKLRDIVWSDAEMEKVVFLKQIISQTAYVFLKYKMRFPLPPLSVVKQWMTKKNIYVKPTRKEKIQNPADTNTTVVGEELNLDNTQIPLSYEPINSNVNDETQDINTLQTQTGVSETAQAVNTIIDDQQPQDVEFGSTLQVYSTLSVPTDTGEQFVYYTYENVNNENDPNNANELQDDNIATVEEVVHSEVVRPPRRAAAEATLRCRLCMRPFDTDQELREHVPLHYYNTYYTSYLNAVKPFVCEFCNESVRHRFDLIHHHRVHLGINSLKCWFPGCTYVGKNVSNLKSHHDCHKARSFKCAECGEMFKTRKYMRQHRARRHATRALLRCALCRATCLSLYTYRRHMDSHQRPPRIKCGEAGCGESFYSNAMLRKHVLAMHLGSVRRYRCSRCPRAQYATETLLNKHLQKHETQKISHCVKCMKVFYDYGEFYAHYMEHKDSESKCKCACGERYLTQEELEEHKLQCTFVSGDNIKRNKKRKRKDENADQGDTPNNGQNKKQKRKHKDAENTDQADTPNNGKTKRRKIINVIAPSPIELSNVVHEKTYERNITVARENNKEQISEENQTFGQNQQELIASEHVMPDDITEKVVTLQINNNQAVIKLADNYPSITNNYTQQVISSTDRQLQKYIVIPKSDQKVLTKLAHQQNVDVNSGSQQQKDIVNIGSQQQIVVANAGSQQQNDFPVSDNPIQKVISVPENRFPKLIVMPKNYQQNVNSMSENVNRNVISVPENNLQKVVVVSNEQRNNISQENESTLPSNQHNIVEVPPNEHKIKNIITENQGHCPKKLTPIVKGSALEKIIAMSTIDKIVSGPQGNYIKRVLALPKDSPLKTKITVSENPVQKAVTDLENPLKKVVIESDNPVNKLIGNHESQFQTVTTDHESPIRKFTKQYQRPEIKVTSDYKISIKSVKVPISSLKTNHEDRAKNVEAVSASSLKKVIAIPEMQCQNNIVPIPNINSQKTLNSIPIEHQGKKVIKLDQTDGTTALSNINSNKVVQIAGTKKLHRVTGLTRQQLEAALANRQKKLIPISKSINIQTQQEDQVQESAIQPDMPILDL